MWATLTGAVLFISGLLYMAWEALGRRRLSQPPQGNSKQTLEPRGQGLRFLSPLRNWLGVVLMVVGGILLLFGMR
ncbi:MULTISPECIES: hypothetical protein [Sinorhizobium]|uniref:Uncharacterized protein n=1 Tax=Rhizobium meliloti TaxID=382 RepID=A0A2J0YW11_RHIML|nr:hypothetical protein [Sinorhizobium meliloti]PJR11762.1 hypothetical protein CEJ86_26775 [Sinorhizobium meliloti]GCA47919.1 hypothetical protein KGO5_00334 [Sinorhizobium sp. KGO-5]